MYEIRYVIASTARREVAGGPATVFDLTSCASMAALILVSSFLAYALTVQRHSWAGADLCETFVATWGTYINQGKKKESHGNTKEQTLFKDLPLRRQREESEVRFLGWVCPSRKGHPKMNMIMPTIFTMSPTPPQGLVDSRLSSLPLKTLFLTTFFCGILFGSMFSARLTSTLTVTASVPVVRSLHDIHDNGINLFISGQGCQSQK